MTDNCIVWPNDMSTESSPCTIHQLEMARLDVDGLYTVRAHMLDNFLLLLDGHMKFGLERDDGAISVTSEFEEVRRRGQPVDKGGYYLDPHILPGHFRGTLVFDEDIDD